jgi:uncharacterized repeat protein (TIGR04138 family)
MASEKTESIQRVVQEDPRYSAQAYYFIFDALDYTLQNMEKARHVTGPELLQGIRRYASDQFGFLAQTVLAEWGVTETSDFGEIVFNLVAAGLLSRSDHDTKKDFAGVYNFEDAFDRDFRRALRDVTITV